MHHLHADGLYLSADKLYLHLDGIYLYADRRNLHADMTFLRADKKNFSSDGQYLRADFFYLLRFVLSVLFLDFIQDFILIKCFSNSSGGMGL